MPSEDELMLMISFALVAGYHFFKGLVTSKPQLMRRNPAGFGLIRVTVLLALSYVVYVLYFHADPSVVGFYRFFYFVIGWGGGNRRWAINVGNVSASRVPRESLPPALPPTVSCTASVCTLRTATLVSFAEHSRQFCDSCESVGRQAVTLKRI